MKKVLMSLLACFALSFATDVLAACSQCSGDGCNPYESTCQCTDPACNRPWDSNCMSKAECCEAFGNIGAR